MRDGIPRRSAKTITSDYANEIIARPHSPESDAKLLAIETIAFRMGWTELYNKLRYRKSQPKPEQWWDK